MEDNAAEAEPRIYFRQTEGHVLGNKRVQQPNDVWHGRKAREDRPT